MINFKTLVGIAIFLSGCSLFQRHPGSGYADLGVSSSKPTQFYNDQQSAKELEAREELGLNSSRPLSEDESQALYLRLQLKRLEQSLVTEREKKQYYHYKPMLQNDIERVQFLKIPNMEGRERYAHSRNLAESFNNFDENIIRLIEKNDIAVGMNQQAVRESWGDPDSIDVAGNELYGNQAWRYTKMVSSEDGYRKEQRIIYFEAGRVVGWESL